MRNLGFALFTLFTLAAGTAFGQAPPPRPQSPAAEVPPPRPTEPAPSAAPMAPTDTAPAPVAAAPMAPAATAAAGGTFTKDTWPGEDTKRSLQLPTGMAEIRANVLLSLSKSAVMKPWSIAPDIYYGVTDKLQAGVTTTGFGTAGNGLCLASKSDGCAKAFNNLGLDALFALLQGANDISAHGSLNFFSLDPNIMKLGLGVAGKLHLAPQMALWFDPQIFIGLNSRTKTISGVSVDNNKEVIYVPVAFQYQVNPQIMAALQAGIWGPTSHFGDFYRIPVGVMGLYNVNKMIDVGLRFTFDNLAGKHVGVASAAGTTSAAPGAADARTLGLVANIRL